MVPERTKGATNLFIELEKHKFNQIDGRNRRTSLQKRVFSEEKPDVGKYEMRDKRQHTLYLETVLMKQPGPAPQY